MEDSEIIIDIWNSSDTIEDTYGGLLTENPILGVPTAVLLGLLCLLTFFGNAVVLHAIRTERRLQTVSNMFIMSLAVADLTVGLVVMPISSAYVLTGTWRFGLVVCQFWLSADYSASTASILNLLVLSLDRYWSISKPLEYMRRRSKKRALIVISFVWMGSFLWILPIIGWHTFFGDGTRKQPPDVCETEFADNVVFKLTTSSINFYCPMIAMIVTYGRIYLQIRERARSEVMNRCSDIHPDSFSSSEISPLRYAVAIQTPKPKKERRKKKKVLQQSPESSEHKIEVPEKVPTACIGTCAECVPPVDTKWRCNMCGATESQVEEWQWPRTQNQEIKTNVPNSHSEEDFSGDSSGDSSKKKKHFRMSRQYKTTINTLASTSNNLNDHLGVPPPPSITPSPSRSSSFRVLCNNAARGIRRRPSSRRSMVSLRQETKAARQLGVIIGAFVLCWLPYMVVFVVTAACESCLGPGVHTAVIWLGYLNSTVNPVIYALCNASFKRAFWKIGTGLSAGWKRRCLGRDDDRGVSENNPFA